MAKSEPKTMRFEECAEIYINTFKGNSFTERFHAMVTFVKDTEKEKKERLKLLDIQIKEKESRIRELYEFLNNVGWIETHFISLKESIDKTKRFFDNSFENMF